MKKEAGSWGGGHKCKLYPVPVNPNNRDRVLWGVRAWVHPIPGDFHPEVLPDPIPCRLPVGVSNGEAGGDPHISAQTWKRKSGHEGG